MSTRKQFRSAAIAFMFAMSLILVASATSFAQGRGHGRGRGPDLSKKCGKFVNCHDARDGRWDGRGPSRRAGLWRDRIFNPRGTRVGNRSYRTDDYWRRRHLNRRGDRDFDRDEFLRERQQNRIERFERADVMRRGRGRP